ncbi:MAG TPA: Mur ligase family protein [Geminicoccaceae bacterium]|nr:Mur ligase family protein [Geminicoccaceae bacterium]
MRHRLRKVSRLIVSSLGRRRLYRDALNQLWPLLRPAAELHRRTMASRVRVIAVVGSFGKTTTTAAVAGALGGSADRRRGNAWGKLALQVLRLRPWERHAVFEAGIDGKGQMIQYAGMMRPDVVVVTAIGSEHNRSLGSLENTRDEKAQMLRGLRQGGIAVLNGDDPHVRAMAAMTEARVVTFGLGPDNDVRASGVRLDWPHGTRLTVHVGGAARELRVRLLGRVMAYPVLGAVAVAWAEGRPLDEVAAALEALPPRPGRLQPVPLPNGAWLIQDDFKSAVETIDAALDVLAEVPGRRIVVLGEISEPPGSAGPHYRHIGERLAAVASRVVVVGGQRTFRGYAAAATRAGLPREALVSAGRSVMAAAQAVEADLRAGDVILIKGRDTQRLDRVALALQGRMVGCRIEVCPIRGISICSRCETCPMLERGWQTASPWPGQPVEEPAPTP